jgi:hypothetical protein
MQAQYSVPLDPDGTPQALRTVMLTPSGGVPVASGPTGVAAAVVISDNNIAATPPKGGFLQRLEATCIVAGNTAGVFELFDDVGASTPRLRLQQPVNPPTIGTRLTWEFPTPIPTLTTSSQFAIRHTSGAMGQWVWESFGFAAAMP